jgi:hypothetical protein
MKTRASKSSNNGAEDIRTRDAKEKVKSLLTAVLADHVDAVEGLKGLLAQIDTASGHLLAKFADQADWDPWQERDQPSDANERVYNLRQVGDYYGSFDQFLDSVAGSLRAATERRQEELRERRRDREAT